MPLITVTVEDKEYYYARDFAYRIDKSVQTIHDLIRNGNKIRKLKAVKHHNQWLVLASELTEFPFVQQGKSNSCYYYNDQGCIDRMEDLPNEK